MSQATQTQATAEAVRTMSLKDLTQMVVDLQQKVEELTAKLNAQPAKAEVKEMTKEHALRVLDGDLKDKKHKEAAETLGLTYGQIYSCRLEYTFKDVHKELKSKGYTNPWAK